MPYEKPKAGEWIQPVRTNYKLACCDCCLVHRMDFRVHRRRVQYRCWRDPRSTGALRAAATKRRKTSVSTTQEPSK